ncbi:MAG: DinB family protein [Pyrinomonadaceae bacterium]
MMKGSEQHCAELRALAKDVKSAFGGFSYAQLNWKPDAASWSVAQCLDHLIRTNESMTAAVRAKLNGEGSSFFEKYSPFSGFFGSYLKKFMVNDSKKAKAPSTEIVPPSDIDGEIVNRFCDEQEKTIRVITDAGRFDPKKTILTSPFLRIMTYSLGDAIDILVEHEKRHFRQAQRVIASPGFPADTEANA